VVEEFVKLLRRGVNGRAGKVTVELGLWLTSRRSSWLAEKQQVSSTE
jgi:hypothetical protein